MQILALLALAAVNWATGAVVVSAVDGSGAATLPVPGLAEGAAWSPDGSLLAVTAHAALTAPGHLYVIRPDGTGLRDLTPAFAGTTTAFDPSWSPDGTRIAFLAGPRFGGPYALDVVDVATGGTSELEPHADLAGAWWSPDGSTIALTEGHDVVTVDVRSHERHVLAYGVLSTVADAWSPDGTQLVYSRVDGLVPHVVVMSRGGGAQRVVGTGAGAAWSPDGGTLAYTTDVQFGPDEHEYELWSSPASGSSPPLQLTGPFARVYVPADSSAAPQFTADGASLVFSRLHRLSVPSVFAANADGTCERAIGAPAADVLALRPGFHVAPVRCVDLRVRGAIADRVLLRKPTPVTVVVENHGNADAPSVAVRVGAASVVTGPLRARSSETVRVPLRPARAGAASYTVEAVSGTSVGRASVSTFVRPCTILGTYRDDVLHGTRASDEICALGGDDTIYARDGRRDSVDCGAGRDVAFVDRLDRVSGCERVVRG